ncbi:hypothetical protein BH11ACT6_BH11ACT6_12010 [soil metagenome]
MDWLYDHRTDCWSVQTTLSVGAYIDLVSEAHQARGALSGQRDVLTTTTAKRIRQRMVSDLKIGAVLPPVVLGVVVTPERFDSLPMANAKGIEEVLPSDELKNLSIIDGMQRTGAIIDASNDDDSVKERTLRVEFWLASNVRAMIYRMLVLNTGQVPWTISRQLTVVYGALLDEIKKNVPEIDKVSSPDKPGRRVSAAQYSTSDLVELYIAFSLRKTAVDTKEAVSDEFSRLDFVENLTDQEFQTQFYKALSMMVRLDKTFSAYEGSAPGRLSKGRAIFDSQPARIGFIVAVGSAVLGRPGATRSIEQRAAKTVELENAADAFVDRLAKFDTAELGDFLRLDVLAEVLDRRVGQIGRYERAVYADAFKVLIEERFVLDNLEPCWRAN